MNKLSLILLATILLTNCSKNDSTVTPEPTPPVATCGSISTFNVAQTVDVLNFVLTTSNPALYYEISGFPASSGSNLNFENGQKFTTNALTFSKLVSELYTGTSTTYIFGARAICTDGSKSGWSTPKTILIADYCNKPTNIRYSLATLNTYNINWDGNSGNSYYQVQWGPQNFTLGSGTIVQTNNTYYGGMSMSANTTYDFYVRSFCNNAIGFSSWTGPFTFLSQTNQNLCATPLNLIHSIENVGSTNTFFRLEWNANGETNFEIVIVGSGQSASTGTPITFNYTGAGWPVLSRPRNNTYNAYIRAVCASGARTNWSAVRIINL